MSKTRWLFIGFLLSALSLIGKTPQVTSMQSVVRALEARYHLSRGAKANFFERYLESGRVVRSEAGTAYFRQPGRMRWEYESPEKNLFLVDGKNAWFYVRADHTVTRVPARKSEDIRTPFALLAGEMKLSRVCAHIEEAKAVQPHSLGNTVIYCQFQGQSTQPSKAERDSNGEEAEGDNGAFLEVEPKTGELARILIPQAGGVQVEFLFSNWTFDASLADSLFHFEVPKGVAIVNGELASRNGQR